MIRNSKEFEFCWTIRRRHLWRECRRKYFYYYYGSRGGHETSAPSFARNLYIAKCGLPMPMYLRRVLNCAMRKIFYASQEEEYSRAEHLYPVAHNIAVKELHQVLSGSNLPKAYCAEIADTSIRPGDICDEMCERLENMCSKLQNGAWGRLCGIPQINRRFIASPMQLDIADLKCAVAPVLAYRSNGDLCVIDGTGNDGDGREISLLYKFAAMNMHRIAPEKVRSFIIRPDTESDFVETGSDISISALLRDIRRDVDEMLGAIREDGSICEKDFPCNENSCRSCAFSHLCLRK